MNQTIIDERKQLEIKEKTLAFVKDVIGKDDFTTIYDLKHALLTCGENHNILNREMMVREKKREKQYQETMEGLKKEIKKLSELVDKLTENK